MGNEDREDICKKLNNNPPSTNELSHGNSEMEVKLCQAIQVDVCKKSLFAIWSTLRKFFCSEQGRTKEKHG